MCVHVCICLSVYVYVRECERFNLISSQILDVEMTVDISTFP